MYKFLLILLIPILLLSSENDKPLRLGVLMGGNYIQNIEEHLWIEKKSLSDIWLHKEDLCSMNIFWLTLPALELLNTILLKFKTQHTWDRKIECYLPTEIASIIREEWVKIKLYSTPDTWFWVTNPEDEDIVKKQIQAYENTIK